MASSQAVNLPGSSLGMLLSCVSMVLKLGEAGRDGERAGRRVNAQRAQAATGMKKKVLRKDA